MGISKDADEKGLIPDNVTYSFYIGAFVLIITILWTIFTTSEYPPEEEKVASNTVKEKFKIPPVMFQLLLVQFFSWFALFSMWVYTTPAVALKFFGTTDANSVGFQQAGDWVGILFGIYNGISAVLAMSLPILAKKFSKKGTHALALFIGGISMISILFFPNHQLLIIPMIGVGIAWASILAMPYAMLANSIPPHKMGMFMGLFNMSITIPQIVSGITTGLILKYWFNDNPIFCIVMAGVSFIIAGGFALRIKEREGEAKAQA